MDPGARSSGDHCQCGTATSSSARSADGGSRTLNHDALDVAALPVGLHQHWSTERDLNPHNLAITCPSSMRVYRFRHPWRVVGALWPMSYSWAASLAGRNRTDYLPFVGLVGVEPTITTL